MASQLSWVLDALLVAEVRSVKTLDQGTGVPLGLVYAGIAERPDGLDRAEASEKTSSSSSRTPAWSRAKLRM